MTELWAKVPHSVLDFLLDGNAHDTDRRVLAFMFRFAAKTPMYKDGVHLLDGELATSYQSVARICGMTSRQAQGAISRLIEAGFITKIREERRRRRGERQYSVYAVRGLVNESMYDFTGKHKKAIFFENQGVFQESVAVEREAVGEAISENGEAVLGEKSEETSVFFDAGGTITGKDSYDISTSHTGSNALCVKEDPGNPSIKHWNDLSVAEQSEIIDRIQKGATLWGQKAKEAAPDQRKTIGQRCDDFCTWYRRLKSGTPDQQEAAYSAYMASAQGG